MPIEPQLKEVIISVISSFLNLCLNLERYRIPIIALFESNLDGINLFLDGIEDD